MAPTSARSGHDRRSANVPHHIAWIGQACDPIAGDRVLLDLVERAMELEIGWLSTTQTSPGRALQEHEGELAARGVVIVRTGEPGSEVSTRGEAALHVVIARPSSGRDELVCAVRRLAERGVTSGDVSEATIGDALAVPDVDLLVVTGGDHRVPDVLLWQTAYSEIVFLEDRWDDVGPSQFDEVIIEYQRRNRRYGGLVASR